MRTLVALLCLVTSLCLVARQPGVIPAWGGLTVLYMVFRLTTRRQRRELLVAATRAFVVIVVGFVWPLVCVRLTWWALHRLNFSDLTTHLIAGSAILLSVAFVTLRARPVSALLRSWRTAAGLVVAAFVAFAVLVASAGSGSRILVAPIALATFTAALAEEVVFRSLVPDWLSRGLGGGRVQPAVVGIAVLVIPQLAFAAAHAENAAFASAGVSAFAILFVAGVLYQGVARVCGLWAAVALHGALNLTIALGR